MEIDEETRPVGRPTAYKPEFCEQARKLAKLGATDRDLAEFFEVTISTVCLWRVKHKDFSEATKVGKAVADEEIVRSLYQRARGYSVDAVKFVTVSDGKDAGSHVEEHRYIEHFPPDPTSMIFWLKNRKAREWRDRQEVEQSGGVTIRVTGGLPDEEESEK